MSDSLQPHGLYSVWNSPGQNTGVRSLSLLQIFPSQGSNPGLPHCRQTLYQLSHKGSPRILEWVAYPFSSGSSWPRNWTGVSCIAGRFLPMELSGKPSIRMAIIKKNKTKKTHKNLQTINAGEDVEKREPSCTVSGNVNSYSYYEEQYGDFFKN